MAQVVEVSRFYPGLPASSLWALCTDFQILSEICRPLAVFEGLPEGRCFEGQRVRLYLRLFGIGPRLNYQMYLHHLDDQVRMFQSQESGAGLKAWAHRCWVEETPHGAILHDRIELDARMFTWFYALYARVLYSHRHRRRLKMLAKDQEVA